MLLPLSRRNIKAAMSRRKHQPPRNSRPAQHDARQQARNPGQRHDTPEKSGHHGHHRKAPPGSGPVWLYGTHACLAALANPERYCRRLVLTRETLAQVQPRLPAQPQPEIVDKSRLDALLPPQAVHQGMALQVEPLDDPGIESLTEPLRDGREIVVLLDQVTDPRNIGAVIRSAAAFGARAVVLPDRHSPEATGALAKAASGGLEVLPLIRVTNLARALDQLAEYGFWRVGLEMETDKTLAQAVAGIKRVALVLGAEDEGLRRLTREKCDFLAKLPMSGAVESLNVSAAAAVALYECARDG